MQSDSALGATLHRPCPALCHGCPVQFWWTRRMALVPLGSGRLATVRTREVNAMLHKNSVFHQLLKHMPWPDFERLVAAHGSDAGVRRLTTKPVVCSALGTTRDPLGRA